MKKSRPENLCVVIGRNRRVYARVYKMLNRIDGFVAHYLEKEKTDCACKREGFRPVGVTLQRPTETVWVFRIQYEPCEVI